LDIEFKRAPDWIDGTGVASTEMPGSQRLSGNLPNIHGNVRGFENVLQWKMSARRQSECGTVDNDGPAH
jgi:hypothetical protein